jgi:ATP-dependent DNA helicase
MDVFNAETTGGENGSRNMRDDRHFVFMLSTRAGGLGINLVSSRSLNIQCAHFTTGNAHRLITSFRC